MAIRKIHPNRAQHLPPTPKSKARPSAREDGASESAEDLDELLSRFTVTELRAYIARRDADDARRDLATASEALPAAVGLLESTASAYLEAWARVQAIPELADSEEITSIRAAAWDSVSGLRWIVSKFGSKRPGEHPASGPGAASGSAKAPTEDASSKPEAAASSDVGELPYRDEILDLLKQQSAMRADAIAAALGCSSKELAPTLKALRTDQLVQTEGAARGMTYSLP